MCKFLVGPDPPPILVKVLALEGILRGDFYWSKYLIVNIVNKSIFIIPERWKFSEQEYQPAEDYTFTL